MFLTTRTSKWTSDRDSPIKFTCIFHPEQGPMTMTKQESNLTKKEQHARRQTVLFVVENSPGSWGYRDEVIAEQK